MLTNTICLFHFYAFIFRSKQDLSESQEDLSEAQTKDEDGKNNNL